MKKCKGKKPLSELRTLQYKKQAHERTISELEEVIEQLKNEKQEWETARIQLEGKLKNFIPLADYSKQLEQEVFGLKSQLSSFEDVKKELEGTKVRRLDLESLIREMLKSQPIGGKYEKHIGFVPHVAYTALIEKCDLPRDIRRKFFYLPPKFWYLHLDRIMKGVEELVIAGLPVEDSEVLSLPKCRTILVNYDIGKIKVPKEVDVFHPRQYFELNAKQNHQNDQIYNKLDLLIQTIDGKDVGASKDLIEEAQLIAEKSPYLNENDLFELIMDLTIYGTIKKDGIREQLKGAYRG